jgi:hypothetical protein
MAVPAKADSPANAAPTHQRNRDGRQNTQADAQHWPLGLRSPAFNEFVAASRDLERKLRELGGMKWLYAHAYYAEAEF